MTSFILCVAIYRAGPNKLTGILDLGPIPLGCIEGMRCRLLLPMCAVSVCQSVRVRQSVYLTRGHSVQPLLNHFGILLLSYF